MRVLPRAIACLLLAASFGTVSVAAEFHWARKRFVYRADGKKLSEVFQDFAASQSIPLVVDASVEGTVNGEFNAKPDQFLDATAKTYGLVWYFDGVTLFIYPSRTMASRVYRMRGYTGDQVKDMLRSLGLGDPRFPLRFNEAEQTLLAYGPPRHLELVQTVIDTLDGSARDQVGKSIQVFPLKFVTAADQTSGGTRVPGLVTVLNNLFSGTGNGTSGEQLLQKTSERVASAKKAQSAAMNFGLLNQIDKTAKDGVRDGGGRQIESESATADVDQERPFFQAEEATNSIIVRGTPERMKQYGALIQQLDVPQEMVEIEASIIDVSTDAFESLGIAWDYANNGNRIVVSPGSLGDSGLIESLAGANITTLFSDAGRSFLARIRALEGGGKARVVARPKVLGAANRQASMVNKRVASVRVAGNLDVNLFQIEAGTTVQVLPSIVNQGGRRSVRLALFIQDGAFEGAAVDQIPIVKRTEIRTEATIREGESLLVGGITVETDSKGRSGLPGLSRVPFFGALFRHDEVSTTRNERLFLITPKVVAIDRSAGLPPPQAAPSPQPQAPQPPAPQPFVPAPPVPAPSVPPAPMPMPPAPQQSGDVKTPPQAPPAPASATASAVHAAPAAPAPVSVAPSEPTRHEPPKAPVDPAPAEVLPGPGVPASGAPPAVATP